MRREAGSPWADVVGLFLFGLPLEKRNGMKQIHLQSTHEKELAMQATESKCGCPCHKVPGVLIALIGFTFLLGALNVLSARAVEITWPILLILLGLKKMFRGMCKCCSAA